MESKQNQNQLLFSFIKQEAYFTVNYKLVKHIGLNPSIFFGEICNEFKYYYEKNLLINDDWFFATTDKIQSRIGFSKFLQSNCIKILQDCKILEMKIMGIPAKKHFKINGTELIDLMEIITQQEVKIIAVKKSNNLTARSQNTLQQEVNLIDNKKSNNLTTIYKEQNIKNKHKEQKNNIKKENVFVEPTNEHYSTTDIVDNTPKYTNQTAGQKNIILTENQYQNIDNSTKNSWPQNDITILEANTTEVVIERNKQYSQDDLITDEHMVLDCFVSAGISVFNDGQFGFGSLINKIADLWTKEDILGELKLKDIGFRNEIKQCCIENNITNQQLVNYFLNKFGKKQITGFRYFFYDSNNNKINWILDELSKINQLTYSKNGNTIQRSTNISGSNRQETKIIAPFGAGEVYENGEERRRALFEEIRIRAEQRNNENENN